MQALAKQHNIHLLTNYETTWYPSNHFAKQTLADGEIGPVRKVVVHDGHKGPKKLGINSEFLDWLTDPELNGGGAIIDFGCYGANLMTWLMNGEKPLSVTAITQQFQPGDYPKVDDEATIVLTYPSSQAIIQASWNWPIARKDMEVYGEQGYVIADDRHQVRLRRSEVEKEKQLTLKERSAPLDDPFALFAAVINGELELAPTDLNSLENNMVVMEILDAAVKSAKTGETVSL
jgi:predicted dehydrogenase